MRVRHGLYKDDLAKVTEVDYATQKASIRLLPRLDLSAIANRVRVQGWSWEPLGHGNSVERAS